MSKLRINFHLQELDKVVPWGQEPDLRLHWFGLTDGLLWIDVGADTIYEYSQAARQYFDGSPKYNDYQISRFLEDFFGTFRYVGESIPEELYNSLEEFDDKLSAWKECYEDEEDEVYEQFYYNKYYALGEWRWDRTLNSGHLVGGPYIGCFRCGEKIKIMWESAYHLEDGNSIWTSPKGTFEMSYNEFVMAVSDFLVAFFKAMDKHVEDAVGKAWGGVKLDKVRLQKENRERREGFEQELSFLKASKQNTDWNQVMMLYSKMEEATRRKYR